ncbi:MAG: tetratricopeptide repeat protein [Myxococcota bacterium]
MSVRHRLADAIPSKTVSTLAAFAAATGLIASTTACTTLSYPEAEEAVAASTTVPEATRNVPSTTMAPAADTSNTSNASNAASAASAADVVKASDAATATKAAATDASDAFGVPEVMPVQTPDESREWHDLTRSARGHRLRGEYLEANTQLAQAAFQLAARPAGNAARRAVFSQRARLARELFRSGEVETAELLAGELFAEAETGPAIGGASLMDLARDTIERRAKEAGTTFSEEEELSLLALSFRSAQTGTATRARVNLGFEVASLAFHIGQLELARDAIDQAVLDGRTTNPLDAEQEGSLKVYKSRIALAQGDLQTAEAAALAANRVFESMEGNASTRGVAEATLAVVYAEKGQTDQALELAQTAYARKNQSPKLYEHALRTITGSLARAEAAAGMRDEAKRHYREALAIPIENSALDERLAASIQREFDALGD